MKQDQLRRRFFSGLEMELAGRWKLGSCLGFGPYQTGRLIISAPIPDRDHFWPDWLVRAWSGNCRWTELGFLVWWIGFKQRSSLLYENYRIERFWQSKSRHLKLKLQSGGVRMIFHFPEAELSTEQCYSNPDLYSTSVSSDSQKSMSHNFGSSSPDFGEI